MTNPLMGDPEIARRCRSCGASIRVRGLFCPQCGKPTSEPASDASSHEPAIDTEEVYLAPETVSVDLPSLPTSDFSNDHPFRTAETVPLQPLRNDVEDSVQRFQESATTRFPVNTHYSPAKAREGEVRPRSDRETLGGDVKKRLGKMREISTVMLEEASYDPSARFVLVAAVLFVLFLVILLLSEMMR
jgi:hypothetical protein